MEEKVLEVFERIVDMVEDNCDLHDVINSGGCGWVSYFMMSKFKSMGMQEDVTLIYLDRSFETSEEIEYNLSNRCGDRSANHLMIRYKSIYFDAKYFGHSVNPYYSEKRMFEVNVEIEDLLDACQDEGQWNSTYDPTEWNDEVFEIIQEAFKQVFN